MLDIERVLLIQQDGDFGSASFFCNNKFEKTGFFKKSSD